MLAATLDELELVRELLFADQTEAARRALDAVVTMLRDRIEAADAEKGGPK
jgi:uncharacterized protein (DUF2267 family)